MNVFTTPDISTEAYDALVGLVYRHSRIHLGEEKQSLIVSRLAKRLRHLRLDSFDEYCALLESPRGADELGQMVDLISTNHTQFFREMDHFDFLTTTILPEWTARLQGKAQPLRVWSAVCSSGEEAYSLAIALAEFAASRPGADWRLDASDISSRMLDRARQGIYPADRVKLPNPAWLSRYFQRGVGEWAEHCRVKQGLREQVAFHQLNLFQPDYPVPSGQHVIFCRNVMIYFDPPTQEELVRRLVGHLAKGGYLIVGHSESLLNIRHSLKQVRPAVYRHE